MRTMKSEVGNPSRSSKLKVLFLCTGNSCRSQMAEGWARASGRVEPYSAGIETHGMNARAAAVMEEAGVPIAEQHSKTVDEVRHIKFDIVITVCHHAHESCPHWLSQGAPVLHVGFDDPPKLAQYAKSEDEALAHYRRVRDEIRQFVEGLPATIETSVWQVVP